MSLTPSPPEKRRIVPKMAQPGSDQSQNTLPLLHNLPRIEIQPLAPRDGVFYIVYKTCIYECVYSEMG